MKIEQLQTQRAARNTAIVKAHETGKTYAAIGDEFGISKQRVWQILAKRAYKDAIAVWKKRPQSEKEAIAKALDEANEKDRREGSTLEAELGKKWAIPGSLIWEVRWEYKARLKRLEREEKDRATFAAADELLGTLAAETPASTFLYALCKDREGEPKATAFPWGYSMAGALALIFMGKRLKHAVRRCHIPHLSTYADDWLKQPALSDVTVADLRLLRANDFTKLEGSEDLLRQFRRFFPEPVLPFEQRLAEANAAYAKRAKEVDALSRRLDYANERLAVAHEALLRVKREKRLAADNLP